MMRLAYLDCFSGVSGNMLLGALVNSGVPESVLKDTLSDLGLSGYRLDIRKISASGLAASLVTVESAAQAEHRHLEDILSLLDRASLVPAVRSRSAAVFTRLAEAEAAVHGTTIDKVHFHEVGAVDAIVDIVGTVAGMHHLRINALHCSPLPMGRGWVACQHGDIPLPGPAVCQLLREVPVYGEQIDQELVTPTGAALVRELTDSFGPMPPMTLEATGYGAGSMQRQDGRPNLLRLITGTTRQTGEAQEVEVIETHLDDWNFELWPHVCDQLLASGALDVSLTPMQMKKGRPGFLLRVLCDPAHGLRIKTVLFDETSAIGLRFRREQRLTLPRQSTSVATPWGEVQAKTIETSAGTVVTPEYESCRQAAENHNIPLQSVYTEVKRHRP